MAPDSAPFLRQGRQDDGYRPRLAERSVLPLRPLQSNAMDLRKSALAQIGFGARWCL
jgi:hypothetical protein